MWGLKSFFSYNFYYLKILIQSFEILKRSSQNRLFWIPLKRLGELWVKITPTRLKDKILLNKDESFNKKRIGEFGKGYYDEFFLSMIQSGRSITAASDKIFGQTFFEGIDEGWNCGRLDHWKKKLVYTLI